MRCGRCGWRAATAALSVVALSCALGACTSAVSDDIAPARSAPPTARPPPTVSPPPAASVLPATSSPPTVSYACTGKAADAAGLQRVINASPVGAVVAIKGGTCLIKRPVALLGDRTYTGGSTTGTVLKQGGKLSAVLASASYLGNSSTTGDPLAIRDLSVACDGTGTTDGIVLLNWLLDVEHVSVSNCGGSGIVDTSSTAHGRPITNTSVNSRFDDNFITHSGQYGFEVADTKTVVTDGYLQNNQIAFSGQAAINLQTASGWDVSGNHLYGNGANAIVADGLYGTTIASNYIEDFGARQRSGTWYGISGTVQGGAGSTILGNKLANQLGEQPGARHVYLAITQTRGGTGYLSVTGNVIAGAGSGSGDVGFSYHGGPAQLFVASAGNEVKNTTPVPATTGAVHLTTGT